MSPSNSNGNSGTRGWLFHLRRMLFFQTLPRIRHQILRSKFPFQKFEIPRHSNHSGVVGRVRETRNEDLPMVFFAQSKHGIVQAAVGANTASDGYGLNARLLAGFHQLVHQDVDDGLLHRGA